MPTWDYEYPTNDVLIKDLPYHIREKFRQLKDDRIVDAKTLLGKSPDSFAEKGHGHIEFSDEFVAGGKIEEFKVLYLSASNQVNVADCRNLSQKNRVIGLASKSCSAGDKTGVRYAGYIENPDWDLIPGNAYYLGLNGAILPSPPVEGFTQKIGIARTDTVLFIQYGSSSFPVETSSTLIDGGIF